MKYYNPTLGRLPCMVHVTGEILGHQSHQRMFGLQRVDDIMPILHMGGALGSRVVLWCLEIFKRKEYIIQTFKGETQFKYSR